MPLSPCCLCPKDQLHTGVGVGAGVGVQSGRGGSRLPSFTFKEKVGEYIQLTKERLGGPETSTTELKKRQQQLKQRGPRSCQLETGLVSGD